jgi:hypothetical protein
LHLTRYQLKFTPRAGKVRKIDPISLLHTEFAGDQFCTRCGGTGALFCFRGGFIGLCSGCTAEALGDHADRLPFDLLVLESEVARATAARRAKERQPETVKLDTFYRCHDCGRLIETRNARYPISHFARGTPPHCTSCYEKIMAGGPVREEEASLFADLAGPGRGAEPREAPIFEPMGPPLAEGNCGDCGEAGSIFVFGYKVLICCPACVANTLEQRAGDGGELDFRLRQLLREARKELRVRKRDGHAKVALTPLTCGCGLSTVSADSDAYVHMQGRSGPPGCPACAPRFPGPRGGRRSA